MTIAEVINQLTFYLLLVIGSAIVIVFIIWRYKEGKDAKKPQSINQEGRENKTSMKPKWLRAIHDENPNPQHTSPPQQLVQPQENKSSPLEDIVLRKLEDGSMDIRLEPITDQRQKKGLIEVFGAKYKATLQTVRRQKEEIDLPEPEDPDKIPESSDKVAEGDGDGKK